ncbi:hypothetical protein [Cyclobacterium marinum]|uniref:Uncharacterized protein n=1 Tax=Cyclobacterium marinum (strain ATCC 25205 / DSM 745 / LMG 13164 / NCIMB 1802) TaxID=880070 RepID=G0J0M3_CYCMS|nr:hypothetical protein [Cyclobacterium marinum]AEL24435.1 hypothetical protein Cycma_0660 [Cyclobacterium marinum DSM 745]MBI0399093.1 hypothetical protein [Cyclobacterium marinum]
MKFIDSLLGNLFSGKSNREVIRENFSRSKQDEQEVTLWLEGEEGAETLKMVYDNYHLLQAGVNKKPEIHLFQSSYANGFAVIYSDPFTMESFSKLFFGLGQRMLQLGYRKVSMDRKIDELNDQVRTTEKLYFKPLTSGDNYSEKIDQLFGNVSLEKIYLDNKPDYLKVLVTLYSDRQYHEAKPFDQFMDKLFKAD